MLDLWPCQYNIEYEKNVNKNNHYHFCFFYMAVHFFCVLFIITGNVCISCFCSHMLLGFCALKYMIFFCSFALCNMFGLSVCIYINCGRQLYDCRSTRISASFSQLWIVHCINITDDLVAVSEMESWMEKFGSVWATLPWVW